ncbi:MAG: YraN family protein [Reichenbachiella sp.]
MKKSTNTQELGKAGEEEASKYYKSRGFTLVAQNYRYKRGEIDLIARKENLIVFVEVKYRKNEKFGFPEEFVSEGQKERIISAADNYIQDNHWTGSIRFDIIALNGKLEMQHFEDAFY